MSKKLFNLISKAEIASTVKRLASELDRDYQNRSLVLVGVLKGSFVFLADLIREVKIPLENIEFLRLSSYESSMVSSGEAKNMMSIPAKAIARKDIVIVEDIIDTGITTNTAIEYLQHYQPASLKLCALLDKPSRRQVPVAIDYLGFTIEDRFIVGYGIDFDQKYRQLPNICYLEEEDSSQTAKNK